MTTHEQIETEFDAATDALMALDPRGSAPVTREIAAARVRLIVARRVAIGAGILAESRATTPEERVAYEREAFRVARQLGVA